MNEEILKEAVNFGATIDNRWDKYTDGGRLFFLSKLFALCREAKKQVEKSSVTDFERGSWLLIQSRIIQKLEDVPTVEMIKVANFSKQKMIELEKDCGGQYLKEVREFIKNFMQENNNMTQEGWICPRCGKVNAPWVMQCFCNRNTHILPKVGAPYYEGDQATCNAKEDKQ